MSTAADSKLVLKNKNYDHLKDLVTMVLPALVTFYAGMGILWGWDYVEQVVASAGLLITFLGVLIKVASTKYGQVQAENPVLPAGGYDGELLLNDTDPERDVFSLNIDKDIYELGAKQQIVLKVTNPLNGASQ